MNRLFQDEVAAFAQRHPYALDGYLDSEVSEWVFFTNSFEQPPERMSVIAGDALQSFRACLEHIAWALTAEDKRGRNTSFPIYTDRSKFRQKIPTLVETMGEAREAFIERCQPFNVTPQDPQSDRLWVLHELARVDRHQLLSTVQLVVVGAELHGDLMIDVKATGDPRFTAPVGEPLQHRTEFMRIPVEVTGPHPYMNVQGQTTTTIFISEFGNLYDMMLLWEIAFRVKATLDYAFQFFSGP